MTDIAIFMEVEPTVFARKIGRHHFAYLRGAVQGVDLRKLWDLYLFIEGPCDLRVAKTTLRWLRDELSVAACRAQQPRLAAVLRRDASRLPQAEAPTLEEFAARYPDGFYTETELQAMWQEEFGTGPGVKRRHRLVKRQLEVLAILEGLVASEPQPDDRVVGWLPESLAARLTAAGLTTLNGLVARINSWGYRWWANISGLGAEGAARVIKWLQMNEASLGLALGQHALIPRRQLSATAVEDLRPREAAIVPLEYFCVPTSLDGSCGTNRGERNKLQANDDYTAIQTWLNAVGQNAHTWRAYRREAERLLLWAVVQQQKPLSSLGMEDCLAYIAFLRHPQPSEQWCGATKVERWSPRWRPFAGGLAERSLTTAVTILGSLFEWLMRQRYLDSNPWDGVRVRPTHTADDQDRMEPPADPTERVLTVAQVRYLLEHVAGMPECEAKYRYRFVLLFAYGTGLRLSELVQAQIGHLVRTPLKTQLGEYWVLKVRGKGGRWRRVPVVQEIIRALEAYLMWRGLLCDPLACAPDVPLIGRLVTDPRSRRQDGRTDLTSSMLYKLLKALMKEAAETLHTRGERADAAQLSAASTHWLRHSFGSHGADQGTPLHCLQRVLGHASLNTTTIYTHPDEELAYFEVERMMGGALQA